MICAEDSFETANLEPIWTPSAPNDKAASIDFPQEIPPAAIIGISIFFEINGTKHIVVVSFLPLWPPASKPSTTIASTPESKDFWANFKFDTTWTTVIPCDFNKWVYLLGFPAEVKTIFTSLSITFWIWVSTWGYNKGIFTPNGLFVAFLHFKICSSNTSEYIDPDPIRPSPPALLTAAQSFHPLHQTIPPWIIGYFIPKSWLTLFIIIYLCYIY